MSVTTSSPNCWLIRRATSGFSFSPVFCSTKSRAVSDQSNLKLVESAEIQICRTGALGEMTNRAPSSKEMCSAPDWSSTSMSDDSSARMRDFLRESKALSEHLRKSLSSSMLEL